jgi:hypothetical protein
LIGIERGRTGCGRLLDAVLVVVAGREKARQPKGSIEHFQGSEHMPQQLAIRDKAWSIYPKSAEEARGFLTRRATLNQATDVAERILSAYPQPVNPVNAECYATEVVRLLSEYPPEVIEQLQTDIVRKTKWIPSVKEIKDEADYLLSFAQRRVAYSEPWTESRPQIKQPETWAKVALPGIKP